MFSALYEFMNDPDNPDALQTVDELIAHIEDLAIYFNLPDEWKEQLTSGEFNKLAFIQYLLSEEGLGLGNLPKGLIPFHIYENMITNPFQEHLIQGTRIGDISSTFHFTINPNFKKAIEERIQQLEKQQKLSFSTEFSIQDPQTDSTAFTNDLDPALDSNNVIIKRPAGHGTLINNLNRIDADIIFIRNIDNVQHLSKANISTNTRQILAGALLEFQADVHHIMRKLERGDAFSSSVAVFNEKFDMRIPSKKYGDEQFIQAFARLRNGEK